MSAKRFVMDWEGKFGEFWYKEARKEVARLVEKYNNGEMIVEDDLAVRWKSNGNYLDDELTTKLNYGGIHVSIEATEAKRKAQTEAWLAEYREEMRDYVPSAEEMAEMRAAFGEGETVVNVITGQTYRL